MIKTKTETEKVLKTDCIICDACGKKIEKNKFNEFDDYYHIEKEWGYHSDKDGRNDSFDICSECYDKMLTVSYTHLDVYKRQVNNSIK